MNMMLRLMTHARAAVESQVHQAEHIKRSHPGGCIPDIPEQAVSATLARPRLPENGVFREESRERKDARNRQRGNAHSRVGDGDALVQIAHVAHILFAAHGGTHGTCAEEEQSLEECMRENMEHACGKCPDAERK